VPRRSGKRRLHVLSADGAELLPIASAIDIRGSALLVSGRHTGPGLSKIPWKAVPRVA